ncbi:MAG: hypothetical protein NUW22_13540 [Acidobacteria bacterium]|nr:hypothetical protein [Acidobacteriota bacterium]
MRATDMNTDVTLEVPVDRAMAGGFGVKALVLLSLCKLPPADPRRDPIYRDACHRFSEKSVKLKLRELQERGYVDPATAGRQARLTPRGVEALESQPMRA